MYILGRILCDNATLLFLSLKPVLTHETLPYNRTEPVKSFKHFLQACGKERNLQRKDSLLSHNMCVCPGGAGVEVGVGGRNVSALFTHNTCIYMKPTASQTATLNALFGR